MSDTTPRQYKIKDIKDFLTIPDEKIDDCLACFKIWIQTRQLISRLDVLGLLKTSEDFIWVDDGENVISSVNIDLGGGKTATVKFKDAQKKEGEA